MPKTAHSQLQALQIAERLLKEKRFRETLDQLQGIDLSVLLPEEKALCYLLITHAKLYMGDYAIARELDYALEYYRNSLDTKRFAYAKYLQGWHAELIGDFDTAREVFNESRCHYLRCSDEAGQVAALNKLSSIYHHLGEYNAAIEMLNRCIEILERNRDIYKKVLAQSNMAEILRLTGSIRAAIALYDSIGGMLVDFNSMDKAIFYFKSAMPFAMKGDSGAARRWITKAFQYLSESEREQAIYYENLGWIYLLGEDYAKAERELLKGLEISLRIAPESTLVSQIKRLLADAYLGQGRCDLARRYADEALAVAARINERAEIAACYRIFARLAKIESDSVAARTWFKKAADIFNMIGSHYELAVTRFLAATSGLYGQGEQQALIYLAREYFEREDIAPYLSKIGRANQSTPDKASSKDGNHGQDAPTIIAEGDVMKRALELARNVAPSAMSILLTGPTGAGKDLLAEHIHVISGRQGKFVSVNSAAMQDNMIEAELFGYRKGAFTGADRDKAGLIEEANGGTFYLNEIGDASLAFQAKLLDALEKKRIRRVGETFEREVDFRLIAATNRDLEKMIRDEVFRADFYYRLKEVRIDLPPLGDRRGDIPALVAHFLTAEGVDINGNGAGALVNQMAAILSVREWPGNIRELRATIACLVRLYHGDLTGMASALCPSILPKSDHDRMVALLEQSNWNKCRVARILHLTEGAIRTRMKKLKNESPRVRNSTNRKSSVTSS